MDFYCVSVCCCFSPPPLPVPSFVADDSVEKVWRPVHSSEGKTAVPNLEYLTVFFRFVEHKQQIYKLSQILVASLKIGHLPSSCLFGFKNRNKSALAWQLFPVFCSVYLFFFPAAYQSVAWNILEEGNFTETHKPSVGVADENTAHCCDAIP